MTADQRDIVVALGILTAIVIASAALVLLILHLIGKIQ